MAVITKYIRTCQECLHKQEAIDPMLTTGDKWRNLACKKCKSEAMDFGSHREFDSETEKMIEFEESDDL